MYKVFEQILHDRGLTSYRVSIDTGIPQATFSRWKHSVATPKLNKLKKISEYLGVTLEELTKEENKIE